MAKAGAPGVVLLENLRYHAEEEANDPAFAKQLAALADVYVNDAFGSAHRAHASTEGIVAFVPEAAAGLLMANEVAYMGKALTDPERPFVAVLGGAKVSDKLEVIQNLLPKVDALVIGGAMAYTFLKAQGLDVGKSLVEADLVDTARDLKAQADARGLTLALPEDHVVAEALSADVPVRDAGRGRRGDRRAHGPRHRPEDRGALRRDHPRREDGGVERPDGRVRDPGVRQRHQHGRRRPWRASTASRSSAAATRSRRSTRPA